MKISLTTTYLLCFVLDTFATEPFTLTIVPSQSSLQGQSISIANDKPHEFYVVLTNSSRDPHLVFENWNSWGYQNVSFELTMPDGTKSVVFKGPSVFTVNIPSTFVISPGESQVYAIRLDKQWETHPKLAADADAKIKVRAIYEVKASPESTERKVWTGRIESKSYALTLRHW